MDSHVTVRMPGGNIRIEISPDYSIRMEGPVTRVGVIDLASEVIEDLLPPATTSVQA